MGGDRSTRGRPRHKGKGLEVRGLHLVLSMTLVLGGLFGPVSAEGQQAGTVARIGYLSPGRVVTYAQVAFLEGMRDLGYVEGRHFVMEYRDAEERPERFAALTAELVALKVDVILAPGTLAALAAKRATTTIPVVVPAVGDPVAAGLVTSLARPGGNLKGAKVRARDQPPNRQGPRPGDPAVGAGASGPCHRTMSSPVRGSNPNFCFQRSADAKETS